MPKTARLTSDAQDYLEDINESYDINVQTSEIIERSLELMRNKKKEEDN